MNKKISEIQSPRDKLCPYAHAQMCITVCFFPLLIGEIQSAYNIDVELYYSSSVLQKSKFIQ